MPEVVFASGEKVLLRRIPAEWLPVLERGMVERAASIARIKTGSYDCRYPKGDAITTLPTRDDDMGALAEMLRTHIVVSWRQDNEADPALGTPPASGTPAPQAEIPAPPSWPPPPPPRPPPDPTEYKPLVEGAVPQAAVAPGGPPTDVTVLSKHASSPGTEAATHGSLETAPPPTQTLFGPPHAADPPKSTSAEERERRRRERQSHMSRKPLKKKLP